MDKYSTSDYGHRLISRRLIDDARMAMINLDLDSVSPGTAAALEAGWEEEIKRLGLQKVTHSPRRWDNVPADAVLPVIEAMLRAFQTADPQPKYDAVFAAYYAIEIAAEAIREDLNIPDEAALRRLAITRFRDEFDRFPLLPYREPMERKRW